MSGRGAPRRSRPRRPARARCTASTPTERPEQLLDDKDEYYTSLAVGDDGRPYVGTGVEGRVYTVDDDHNEVLVADIEERQVGALLLKGKQRFVAASDPAVVHPVKGIGGADAVWTSKVLDAGLRAHFGRMDWTRDGSARVVDALRQHDGAGRHVERVERAGSRGSAVTSPAARFLQVRARWNQDPKRSCRRDHPVRHRQPARRRDGRRGGGQHPGRSSPASKPRAVRSPRSPARPSP